MMLVVTLVGFHTMDDHNAPVAKFFLMDCLGIYKGVLEEGAKLCGLVESDHTVY